MCVCVCVCAFVCLVIDMLLICLFVCLVIFLLLALTMLIYYKIHFLNFTLIKSLSFSSPLCISRFKKASTLDPSFAYPHLMWDLFPKARFVCIFPLERHKSLAGERDTNLIFLWLLFVLFTNFCSSFFSASQLHPHAQASLSPIQ